jgi:DNA primase
MDVVALAAAGIAEAVAPLGTALTEHQIERLWRVTECPTLCFDGDAAGQRAAMKAVTRALPLLRPGHSLRIVTLPDGMDPDDVVKKRGREAMLDLLGTARSLVDVLWDGEREAAPLATPEDKAGLKARLLAHCETIQHPDIKTLYRRELLDRFGELAFARRERPAFTPRQGGGGSRAGSAGVAVEAGAAAPARRHGQPAATESRLGRCPARRRARRAGDPPGRPAPPWRGAGPHSPGRSGMAALLDALLAFAESGAPLESATLRPILAERQLRVPSADDYDGLRSASFRKRAPPRSTNWPKRSSLSSIFRRWKPRWRRRQSGLKRNYPTKALPSSNDCANEGWHC